MEEIVAELRRPVPVESVGFKVQAFSPKNNPKRAQIVSFIDARLVGERLNHVIPGDWSDAYVAAPVGRGLECRLTVAGSTRSDVGFAENTDTDMGLKALYSDAFKRAGVKFGIGAFLYALPKMVVPISDLTKWGDKFHLFDDSPAMGKVTQNYEAWLERHGVAHFGEPLSHGDADGAQGDIEAVPASEPVDTAQEPSRFPERYVDWLRLAIRSHDKTELADEVAWQRDIDAATTPELRKAMVERLEAVATDLGVDVKAVSERWQANKIRLEQEESA